MPERLDKFLSSQNICSRKDSVRLARAGAIAVNGVAVKDTAQKIDPLRDTVSVNGEEVSYRKYLYIMMNKPAGVLSATEDSRAKTVLDLLPPELFRRGLFPAGRLDKDTTGLLIITDDGDFAHRMLAPKSHVYKLYEATVRRPVTKSDITAFESGITHGGQSFAPARLWQETKDGKELAMTEIREGKFHQVKRMFQAVGNEVLALKRIRIGGLSLDETLSAGEARLLTPQEIDSVFTVDFHENGNKSSEFRENS